MWCEGCEGCANRGPLEAGQEKYACRREYTHLLPGQVQLLNCVLEFRVLLVACVLCPLGGPQHLCT